MKLEATKFRPREVVKHVLQTSAASLQKTLTLEGHVADDVPTEVKRYLEPNLSYQIFHSGYDVELNYWLLQVIGDVLRIRQILTNLVRY